MNVLPKDPLLVAARVIILLLMGLLVVVATALVIAAGYVAFEPTALAAEFAKEGFAAPDRALLTAIVAGILLGLVPVGLIALFLLNLLRLVDSVGAGDPFAPINAERLARMGWLTLGVQLAGAVLAALAAWIGQRIDVGEVDVGVSGSGVVLAVVLFILARVFRKGAEMRAELEGTV